MFTQTVFLAVASAAIVSADIFPAHQNFKRVIEARQTAGGDIASCIQPLVSIASTIPTPPPEIKDLPPPADPCDVTVPPSVAPAYSSYSSEFVSWFGLHSSEIYSALSACPEITSLAGAQISSIEGSLCTKTDDHASMSMPESSAEETGSVAPSASGGSVSGGGSNSTFSSATPTGPTGGAGGPAQTTSKSVALAARETGFVGAAIAAVGFLGAIAAL